MADINYVNQGLGFLGQKNWDGAIESFTHVIEQNPDDFRAYTNRGVAYKEKGEYDRAIEDYDKALELNPDSKDAIHNRAVALALRESNKLGGFREEYENKAKQYEQAEYFLDRSLRRSLMWLLGLFGVFNSGLTILVVFDFIKPEPLSLLPWVLLGSLGLSPLAWRIRYLQDEKLHNELLKRSYERKAYLEPNDTEAHSTRAAAYNDKGEYALALEDLKRVIESNSNDALAYNNRGNIYVQKREFDQAVQDYNKALKIDPQNVQAIHNRAVALTLRDSEQELKKRGGQHSLAISAKMENANDFEEEHKIHTYQRREGKKKIIFSFWRFLVGWPYWSSLLRLLFLICVLILSIQLGIIDSEYSTLPPWVVVIVFFVANSIRHNYTAQKVAQEVAEGKLQLTGIELSSGHGLDSSGLLQWGSSYKHIYTPTDKKGEEPKKDGE